MRRLLLSAAALAGLGLFVVALSAYNRAFHPVYVKGHWEPY